jgi:hypothetical protein
MGFALAAVMLATTVQGPADVEAMTFSADAVVHGRVVGTRSHPGAGGGLVFTEVSIAPIGWWKGTGGLQPIAVRVEGGIIGDIGQTVAGAPAFTPGDEVVVFLRRIATGLYDVERYGLGKFLVKPGAGGRLHATRDRSRVSCAGCSGAEEDDFALDDLRDRVRRAAGPAAR